MFRCPFRSRPALAIIALSLVLAACAPTGPAQGPYGAASVSAGGAGAIACLRGGSVLPSAYVQPMKSLDGPGACGAEIPFTISALPAAGVGFAPNATLACSMIPRVEAWLANGVQRGAETYFREPVREIEVAASYACRSRNGRRGAKLSEHGYANALDVRAFRLASGRRVSVDTGWRGPSAERQFLRHAHRSACGIFSTVIGPDGDRYHHDHLHVDFARRGKSGYRYCK